MSSHADKNVLLSRLCIVSMMSFICYKIYEQNTKNPNTSKRESLSTTKDEKTNEFEIITGEDNENEKLWKSDKRILPFQTDHFRGIRVMASRLPKDKKEWELKLDYSLREWKSRKFRGIWIKLPVALVSYLEYGIKQGLTVHHATNEYIMLYKWLPEDEKDMIPDHCHSYLGVGALIVNEKRQCVAIQEKWNFGRLDYWKTPGGAVDRCEPIHVAVVREAREETGIECEFISMVGFRQLIPYRFGNTTDLWFLCLLRPVDSSRVEFKKDDKEIADIKWMDLDEFMNLECSKNLYKNFQFENIVSKEVDWLLEHWNDRNSLTQGDTNNTKTLAKHTSIGFHCLPSNDKQHLDKIQESYVFKPNAPL